MASSVMKGSFKNVITRNYAAQAAAATKQQTYTLPHHQPEISKLPNGGIAISLENNSPISRIAVFVKSGARYETPCNKGISHMLRLCAGLATENYTAFGITRHTQQLGGTLVCHSGKEFISYELAFLRDNFDHGFDLLKNVALTPTFKPWELNDQMIRLKTELAARSPTVLVLDMLHTAAFRNSGLGNSLFMPNHHIGSINSEQLNEFFNGTHTASRMAYVGLGIEHKPFVKLTQKISSKPGDGILPGGTYGGGEVRQENGDPLAYIAVAGPGAKIGSEESLALAIAQFILGGYPGTKYGLNASSKLSSFVTSAGGTGTAAAINVSYSDAGLFGFLLIEEAAKAADVLKVVAKGIRTLKITDTDVKNAKCRAKAAVLMASESAENELEEMGLQALFTGKYQSPSEIIAALDNVTAAAVQSALNNVTKGKPSMSAFGGIGRVPYLDQL